MIDLVKLKKRFKKFWATEKPKNFQGWLSGQPRRRARNVIARLKKWDESTTPFELTRAEIERLAILSEECAEVQQIIGKILRHGYGSHNPFDESKTPNRELLNKELGDLTFAIGLLQDYSDVNDIAIMRYRNKKRGKIRQYLHFNNV